MWALFVDGNSGGYHKFAKKIIYIEADNLDEAIVIFTNMYQNPHNITCSCCGTDFYFYEFENLEDATKYNRELLEIKDLDEYLKTEDFFMHYKKDIDSVMKIGEVPTYEEAWIDCLNREEEYDNERGF